METALNFVSIIIIVFGILQIILFFKLWGMTNDIREMKNKYMDDQYKRTIEGSVEVRDKRPIQPLEKDIKKEISPKSELLIKKDTTPTTDVRPDVKEIDLESEDFKKLLNRWAVLKKRGFTQQAINEYVEKTSLSIEDAEKFIEEL
jgi:predicted translin family RNA/ssDNA-binding protein|uniref:Uncharacterized protein n=1 Tax=Myoviridae sp. ctxym25 TaxID=2825210 RepID=A0A8S5QHN0_9CAUD|nr:MAG TPA: hypothetical protein [Myoviridae sp. ctxym25]